MPNKQANMSATSQQPGKQKKNFLFRLWLGILAAILSISLLAYFVENLKTLLETLPERASKEGKQFLSNYEIISHDIFLIILVLVLLILVCNLVKSCSDLKLVIDKRNIKKVISNVIRHPFVCGMFVIYMILIVNNASWHYPELVGWYSDIFEYDLLENFRFLDGFVGETMRRNDFRFFPLAHQDIHLLSWLTPYPKVWAILNSIELAVVVIFITKFVRKLTNNFLPSLLLLTTVLVLINPVTAVVFFQFVYSERLLATFLVVFIYSYLCYQQTQEDKYFYLTLITALLGIFLKDTAFIFFIGPAVMTFCLGFAGRKTNHSYLPRLGYESSPGSFRLERWLILLMAAYLVAYFFLSFLPSTYLQRGMYGEGNQFSLVFDGRILMICLAFVVRLCLVFLRKIQVNLVDALNASAIVYILATAYFVDFSMGNHLSFPVQIVFAIDLTYFVALLTQSYSFKKHFSKTIATAFIFVVASFAALLEWPSFLSRLTSTKNRQDDWASTYYAIKKISKQMKRNGQEVNIIFAKGWYNEHRHLNRLTYDRLIKIDSATGKYIVKEGMGRRDKSYNYMPKDGDLLLNIDRQQFKERLPMLDFSCFQLLYDANPSVGYGKIYRYMQSQCSS